MVFVAAGANRSYLRTLDVATCIAPSALSMADPAGGFLGTDHAPYTATRSICLTPADSVSRSIGPALLEPVSLRGCATELAAQNPALGQSAPPLPAALQAEHRAFCALREQVRETLTKLQLFSLVDPPAPDVIVSGTQLYTEQMVSALLAGLTPFEIEWVGGLKSGSVLDFLAWLAVVPVGAAIEYVRAATIRTTLEPMFELMGAAGMLDDTREGRGYRLCRYLVAVFRESESDETETLEHALQDGDLLYFPIELYRRGPSWGFELLRAWVAQDEAEVGARLIEQNLEAVSLVKGPFHKVLSAMRQAKQSDYGLDRALLEEGLNAQQVAQCKTFLIRFKAEVVLEKVFAKTSAAVPASAP